MESPPVVATSNSVGPTYARLGPRISALIRDLFVYAGGGVLLVLFGSFISPEGELQLLESAWREAEEIAGIADNLLVPPWIEERLSAERGRGGGSRRSS